MNISIKSYSFYTFLSLCFFLFLSLFVSFTIDFYINFLLFYSFGVFYSHPNILGYRKKGRRFSFVRIVYLSWDIVENNFSKLKYKAQVKRYICPSLIFILTLFFKITFSKLIGMVLGILSFELLLYFLRKKFR